MNLSNYIELVSLLIALILYKHLFKQTAFIYFIPYLTITSSVELIAIGQERAFKNVMYNYYLVTQFVFFVFLFYKNLNHEKFKKIVLISFASFILFFILTSLFLYSKNEYHGYTSVLSSFFVVIFICMYFYEAILPQTSQVKLIMIPFFWVAVGLLLFNLGSVIIFAMFKFLTSIDFQKKGIAVFQAIITSLNVILYGSFSIAFILCRNKKTSSSPS